jgi:hypothetical protein
MHGDREDVYKLRAEAVQSSFIAFMNVLGVSSSHCTLVQVARPAPRVGARISCISVYDRGGGRAAARTRRSEKIVTYQRLDTCRPVSNSISLSRLALSRAARPLSLTTVTTTRYASRVCLCLGLHGSAVSL